MAGHPAFLRIVRVPVGAVIDAAQVSGDIHTFADCEALTFPADTRSVVVELVGLAWLELIPDYLRMCAACRVRLRPRVVCAWCDSVISEGNPAVSPSHGICPTCSDAVHESDKAFRELGL